MFISVRVGSAVRLRPLPASLTTSSSTLTSSVASSPPNGGLVDLTGRTIAHFPPPLVPITNTNIDFVNSLVQSQDRPIPGGLVQDLFNSFESHSVGRESITSTLSPGSNRDVRGASSSESPQISVESGTARAVTTAGNNVDVSLPPVRQPENPGSININMLRNIVRDAIVEILPTFLRPSCVSLIPPTNNVIYSTNVNSGAPVAVPQVVQSVVHSSVAGSPSFIQSDSHLLSSATNVQPVSGSTSRVSGVAGQSVQVAEDNMLGFAGSPAWLPTSSVRRTAAGVAGEFPAGGLTGHDSAGVSASGGRRPLPSVPAVPHRFVTQVSRGEFVDFHSLFAAIVSVHNERSGYTFSFERALEDFDDGRGGAVLNVRPRRPKREVTTFDEWLRVWNEYLAVVTYFNPHLLPQMVRYQTAITRYANRFEFDDWMAYDIACRHYIANNCNFVSWDDALSNGEIYDAHLRHASVRSRFVATNRGTRDTSVSTTGTRGSSYQGSGGVRACFSCGQPGHIQRHCMTSGGSRVSASSASTSVVSSSSGRGVVNSSASGFRAPQRSGPCYEYNDRGSCNRVGCVWSHRCSLCPADEPGDHPRIRCHRRSDNRR